MNTQTLLMKYKLVLLLRRQFGEAHPNVHMLGEPAISLRNLYHVAKAHRTQSGMYTAALFKTKIQKQFKCSLMESD